MRTSLDGRRLLLDAWRLPARQVGVDLGRKGMKDEEIVLLRGIRNATFFTRDAGFYAPDLRHSGYCIVVEGVGQSEAAAFICRPPAPRIVVIVVTEPPDVAAVPSRLFQTFSGSPQSWRATQRRSFFVSVNEFYVRISSREGTQPFQAYAAASSSRAIPAMWADTGLERPGEVACIAGQ